MKEIPCFFPNGSNHLFGVLHKNIASPKGEGVVLCSPFVEEKLWSHRVFVNLARELVRRGYDVLRFDYMGHGDSDGEFRDLSVETQISDIRSAIAFLQKEAVFNGKISLLGLRLGATLASMVAEEERGISKLILWEPILNGAQYMRELIRANLVTQTAIYREILYDSEALIQQMQSGGHFNIEGYEIVWPLYQQALSIKMSDAAKKYEGDVLLLQIRRKSTKLSERFSELKRLYPKCDAITVVEEPFWKEIRSYYPIAKDLFRVTLEWMERV